MNFVQKAIGFPDEMYARTQILEECERLGSKAAFCEAIGGLDPTYLSQILTWKRPPAHQKILDYFHWDAIYMTPEDYLERVVEPRPETPQEKRDYWKRKQQESRQRRKGPEREYCAGVVLDSQPCGFTEEEWLLIIEENQRRVTALRDGAR